MRTIIRNDYTPELGDYHERIVIDETKGKQWLFDCDGVFTDIAGSDIEIANEFGDRTGAAISQKFFTDTVEAEIAAREEADTALAGDILAERTARTNADAALQAAVSAEQTARQNADTNLQDQIDDIEEVIPSQASASNQLADKNFVNSSVATNTAYYISNNGQPFNSVAELEAYSGPLTNNDYAFVVGTDAQGNTFYDRYKYNADTGEWAFEYELNNSSFTANQWAAINSGITSGDVTKLQGLANIQTIGTGLALTNGELSATSTGPTVVQTTGTSTTDVMSQNAVTSMVFADITNRPTAVRIGNFSSTFGTYGNGTVLIGSDAAQSYASSVTIGQNAKSKSAACVSIGPGATAGIVGGSSSTGVAVGSSTNASGDSSVALGHGAAVGGTAPGSVALGAYSSTSTQGEVNIGTTSTSYGYSSSNYRLLSGLYDPQSDHDAATKGYVDSHSASAFSTNEWNALWA